MKKIDMPKVENVPDIYVSSLEGAQIKIAVDAYLGLQKAREQTYNRINMFVQRYGLKEEDASEWHDQMDKQIFALEKDIKKKFKEQLKQFPIWEELNKVKGVAETLSAQLIAIIQNPERFATISKLWKFSGVGLNEDGSIQKRKKGELINYNPRLKMVCWKLTDSWNKHQKSYYGKMQLNFKKLEEAKNKPFKTKKENSIGYLVAEAGVGIKKEVKIKKNNYKKIKKDEFMVVRCKGHIFNRARRKTVKRFLADFYVTWMKLNGKEYRNSYLVEKLGHEPIDYGLPDETL